MIEDRYASPAAVEAAIRSAAQKASAVDPSISLSDRIRQEYFRRFLSRVFSDTGDGEWMLKGGTGVLARVGSARVTRDVDLFRNRRSLEMAVEDLKRAAAVDLGDYFHFEYTGHRIGVGGTQQAYTEGCQVKFDVYIGANRRDVLSVDLVVNAIVTDEATITFPANGLDLPKLLSTDYKLYPLVDQIADKVCATLAEYNGKPSSREWDLVDLVVLAVTEPMDADKLWRALSTEAHARSLTLPEAFNVPRSWGRRYAKEAKPVPACRSFQTIGSAMTLMGNFIDPVLRRGVAGATWVPDELHWCR